MEKRYLAKMGFLRDDYLDGANVVGTIDENDKIIVDNVADNGEQIINLIPLN